MKTTIIILQIEEMRYIPFESLYGGKVKEMYDSYVQKLNELNQEYKSEFILPCDNVGFCTEFALNGKEIGLAEKISKDLYDFFKSYETENFDITVNIVIGYGEMGEFNVRIHTSTGEPLIRVGRKLDKERTNGIKII